MLGAQSCWPNKPQFSGFRSPETHSLIISPVLQFSDSRIPVKEKEGLLSIFRYFYYSFCHLLWCCKNDLYSCEYHEKNSDLNSVQKKLFILNECAISCKTGSYWFENDAQNKSFRAKPRNFCARELTVSWKPWKGQTGYVR